MRLFTILLAVCFLALSPPPASAAGTVQDQDRIIFVGDSITGQGAKGGKGGWIGMIGEGLALARPTAKPTLIGLGGSGSTVGAWQGFEKRSRTGPLALDVKETDVGQSLDAGAQILVVMLGMNDVLAPTLKGDTASYEAWVARYRELLDALSARCRPRTIALATVTPCTEDPNSPKNQAVVELNRRLALLAQERQCLLLPTHDTSFEIQKRGRTWKAGYSITTDQVHPNRAGHLAIAAGMLRGLGEGEAAAQLLAKYADVFDAPAKDLPALSYTLERVAGENSPDTATHHFIVKYQCTPAPAGSAGTATPTAKVTLTLPPGWQAGAMGLSATTLQGQFACSGPLDRLTTNLTLKAELGAITREQTIAIPAGWRVAVGRGKATGWTQNTYYDPAKDVQPLDESLASGAGTSLTSPVLFPAGGEPSPWRLHIAAYDYTGRNQPGSIDFAALEFFHYGQMAYGARWIHSDRDRPVTLDLGASTFAGVYSLNLWLNGQPVSAGKMKKTSVPANLKRGWNLLFFKTTYIQWQWQFAIDVKGQPGDDLSDLKYATRPPGAGE